MKLFTYYRSTAAYRVRIALYYKGLAFESESVDLIAGQQHEANYLAINPQARVPTLIDDKLTLGQSLAILEYLEERYPEPPLLPQDKALRAKIRAFSQVIVSDMHQLNNSSTLKYLQAHFNPSAATLDDWYRHWLKTGFAALENLLQANDSPGPFCFGGKLSFADLCLIPQVYNAIRIGLDMASYPHIMAVNAHCLSLPCFKQARPENQADYQDNASGGVVP